MFSGTNVFVIFIVYEIYLLVFMYLFNFILRLFLFRLTRDLFTFWLINFCQILSSLLTVKLGIKYQHQFETRIKINHQNIIFNFFYLTVKLSKFLF